MGANRTPDLVVVGAGFAGLYALYASRARGWDVVVLEAGSGVGGTWYWNRYPGARCDVESMDYSYGFSDELLQEWTWSERFATQPEIREYLDHVADRFDLRSHIELETTVVGATYDERTARWEVIAEDGRSWTARFLVMATGALSLAYVPPFAGLDDFLGSWCHTGRWPDPAPSFEGRRVGIIGTGSSGIQVIPEIAKSASKVVVYQRTPNFTLPARNGPLPQDFVDARRREYSDYKRRSRRTFAGYESRRPPSADSAIGLSPEDVEKELESRWQFGGNQFLAAFRDVLLNEESNAVVAEFVRNKIAETVQDPTVADLLTPKGYPIGAKRICVDTDYYATFNRPNVELVDLRSEPIERITPQGVRTARRHDHLDMLVFATGYDAMTGPLRAVNPRGRDGVALVDAWANGPTLLLGILAPGFPNMFVLTGPGSPSVRANVAMAIEQHVDWMLDCLDHMRDHGKSVVEAELGPSEAWMDHVADVADQTIFVKVDSWYMGSNIPGKRRMFMPYVGGLDRFDEACCREAAAGYPSVRFE
jgi:cyclohexanone monooxygenase